MFDRQRQRERFKGDSKGSDSPIEENEGSEERGDARV